MTDLLAAPAVRLGFGVLGISPPPPFPAAFDEHIATWDEAAAKARRHAEDAEAALRLMSGDDGPAVAACRATLTAADGPLSRTRQLATGFDTAAAALRVYKGLSTAFWTAVAGVAAATGVIVGAALVTGWISLAAIRGALESAWATIRRLLGLFRNAVERVFRSLYERILHGRRYVDLNSMEMSERFKAAPIFEKTAIVRVRTAKEGEKIHTIIDGGKETVNVAREGELVVINPGGEEYIPRPGVIDRYDEIGPGLYRAKGMVRAFQNPTGGRVAIKAPWAKMQYGERDAWFAVTVDPANPGVMGEDRYIIAARAFADTYVART